MKVSVFCGLGLSTSIVVKKIRKEAESQGINLEIDAYSLNDLEFCSQGADLILLGPQVRNQINTVKKACMGIPVRVISPSDYGTGNTKNILKLILDTVEEEQNRKENIW